MNKEYIESLYEKHAEWLDECRYGMVCRNEFNKALETAMQAQRVLIYNEYHELCESTNCTPSAAVIDIIVNAEVTL